jgi:hypothetical protein
MVNDTCLDSSLIAAQSLLLRDLKGYRRLQRLNNSEQKEVIQTINKTTYQTVPKY